MLSFMIAQAASAGDILVGLFTIGMCAIGAFIGLAIVLGVTDDHHNRR